MKQAGLQKLSLFFGEYQDIPIQKLHKLTCGDDLHIIFRLCFLKLLIGFKQNLSPKSGLSRLLCVVFQFVSQSSRDQGCSQHNSKGKRISRLIGMESEPWFCEQKIKQQYAYQCTDHTADMPFCKKGNQQNTQNIHSYDISFCKAQAPKESSDSRCSGKDQQSDQQILSGRLNMEQKTFLQFIVFMVYRGVRNNVNIQVRGIFNQFLCKGGRTPEMAAVNVAATDDNLCDIGNTSKFCNLIGDIICVNRRDCSTKLFCKADIFLHSFFVRVTHFI